MTFKKIIKKKWFIAMVVFVVLLTTVSTVTHEYGPYYGKVVDAETKAPIEGAVLVLVFFTNKYGSPGGPVRHQVDVREAVTDKNGEFRIPAYRYFKYRIFSTWDPDPMATIYKSGFGCYRDHKQAKLDVEIVPSYSLPARRYTTAFLPKLLTIEERMAPGSRCTMPTTSYDQTPHPAMGNAMLVRKTITNKDNKTDNVWYYKGYLVEHLAAASYRKKWYQLNPQLLLQWPDRNMPSRLRRLRRRRFVDT